MNTFSTDPSISTSALHQIILQQMATQHFQGNGAAQTRTSQTLSQFIVAQIATPRFQMLQRVCFFGYGLKVFLCDGPLKFSPNTNKPLIERISNWSTQYYQSLRSNIENVRFNIVYGTLFMGSGLAGMIAVLQQFDAVNLGYALKLFEGLDIGLFLAGCVYALKHNINQYEIAKNLPNPAVRKNSALMGIISNFAYLFWGLFYLYGATTASVLLCIIGLSTGGLKILYDYAQQLAPA